LTTYTDLFPAAKGLPLLRSKAGFAIFPYKLVSIAGADINHGIYILIKVFTLTGIFPAF